MDIKTIHTRQELMDFELLVRKNTDNNQRVLLLGDSFDDRISFVSDDILSHKTICVEKNNKVLFKIKSDNIIIVSEQTSFGTKYKLIHGDNYINFYIAKIKYVLSDELRE